MTEKKNLTITDNTGETIRKWDPSITEKQKACMQGTQRYDCGLLMPDIIPED